jgi:hypothetical protein
MRIFKSIVFVVLFAAVTFVRADSDYVVVSSIATNDDASWKTVVEGLQKKHGATVVTYEKNVADAREKIAALAPRYVCFVARPSEAGSQYVIDIHRFLRKLNDDPYTDALWGIVTGRTASDALKIVEQTEPLVIRKGAAGTGIPLDKFDEARTYSEGQAGGVEIKTADGKIEKVKGPQDSTKALVDAFNDFKTDLFFTSGHASERNWQIGYSYTNGYFVCKKGVLYGMDMQKKLMKIDSPNPKVYMPLGNCLMGHIADEESMALAFMGSGGVRQMCGYVVPTWFGYGGWGVQDYFFAQPGRFSYAESVYLNNQALVNRLEREFPDKARIDIDTLGMEHDRNWFGKTAEKLGIKGNVSGKDKDLMGLLYDRDVVAFYGDPKWDARMAPRELPWSQSLTEKDGVFTFELSASKSAKPGRPPAAMLPRRIGKVEIVEGKEFEPVVGAWFVMLPKATEIEAGKTIRVVFKESK